MFSNPNGIKLKINNKNVFRKIINIYKLNNNVLNHKKNQKIENIPNWMKIQNIKIYVVQVTVRREELIAYIAHVKNDTKSKVYDQIKVPH